MQINKLGSIYYHQNNILNTNRKKKNNSLSTTSCDLYSIAKNTPTNLLKGYYTQAFVLPTFQARKILEYPFYNLDNYIPNTSIDKKLAAAIKKLIKPNGEKPFKKDKDIRALIDGLRDKAVREFQFEALGIILLNPLFEKAEDITKLISQINTVERGELFLNETNRLTSKYPQITAQELVSIVPRLTPEKLEIQESFIDNIYMQPLEKADPEKIDIFSELLSSIEDKDIAKIQLAFYKDLTKFDTTSPKTAISLLMNIDKKQSGVIKRKNIIQLIEKGFKPDDLIILIPKIRNASNARLNLKMADYFLKEKNMSSEIASKIMSNISDEVIFNMHKEIIEEMTKLRDFEGIDILKTLGDIHSPEIAELKTAVIKELAKIDKLNGHDIMHIVTNVDAVYGAEIKVKTAKKLAEIKELKGEHIAYIVAGCHNEESARVKHNAAEELVKIPDMNSEAIATITSRLLKEETAKIQIEATKEILKYKRFSINEIAKIVRGMRNIDFKKAKIKALEHLLSIEKLDNNSIVKILEKINGESKDKYLMKCIDKMAKDDQNFTLEDITKIATTLVINKHTCDELIDYFATIPQHIKKEISNYAIVQDFYPFKDKTYLNKIDRKAYIASLIKHNTAIYDKTGNIGVTKLYKFLPVDNAEFCLILPLLTASVDRITTFKNPRETQALQDYNKTLEDLYFPNSPFLEYDFEKTQRTPILKYRRAHFINDVNNILKDCPPLLREQLTDQFGFILQKGDVGTTMVGYPYIPHKYTKVTNNPENYLITKNIENCIKNFIVYNEVCITGNKTIDGTFNQLLKAIPELYTLVEKPQNEWHHFDTFVHTLRVMQEVAKNERFKKLSPQDKKILFTAAILHDLTKKEYVVDKGHSLTGAYDAYQISKRLGMSPTDRSKLFAIIRNHEWLKYYNKEGVSELQKIERAKTVAFTLREGNAFDLVSILSEADLKGMQKSYEAYEVYKDAQKEGNSEVARYIRDLQRTAIPLPQQRLPKASELIADGDVVRDANIGGIKNKVIYLYRNMGKGSLPFDLALDPNDFNLLVHALDSEKNSLIFQRMDEVDNDTLISASYVNLAKGNWKTFRQQGYILDVDSDNIHAAYFKDYGSGATKNIDNLKLDYLFEGYFKPQRDYISHKIKEKLHIDSDSYKSLYQDIKNKTLSEIREEYPFVSAAIKQIYMEMQGGQYTFGRNYNEVLVSRPRIQGVFAYDRSITQVPKYLRQYAADADIPIIIFLD